MRAVLLDPTKMGLEIVDFENDQELNNQYREKISPDCKTLASMVLKINNVKYNILADDDGLHREKIYPSSIYENGEIGTIGTILIMGKYLGPLQEEYVPMTDDDVLTIMKRVGHIYIDNNNKYRDISTSLLIIDR